MYQPSPEGSYAETFVIINNTLLKSTEKFSYLGSIVSNSTDKDDEITQRIAQASGFRNAQT